MIQFFSPPKLVLLAALAVSVIAGFVLVPPGTILPVHWNIDGEADLFLPREWALVVPAFVVALVWAVFLGVDRFMNAEQREAGASIADAALTVLTATFLGILVATIAIGLGLPVSMLQVVAAAIGLLLVVLGNVMPKSRPNAYAGIRMPTTLRSQANWQATHRLGGWLAIAGGIVLLAAAFMAPNSQLLWWVVGCVIGPILVASTYSLLIARRTV